MSKQKPQPEEERLPSEQDASQPDAAASEPAAEQEEQEQSAASLDQQLAEANDRALRAHAELENVRKRMRREMDEQQRYAALPLMRDLLPVLDNLQRAIEASRQNDSQSEGAQEGLLSGVEMVATQLEGALAAHHCQRIDALGETFDPNLHEAMGQLPHDDYPANTVAMETQTGYRLHDRVIRPAQVFISTGPAADDAPTQ